MRPKHPIPPPQPCAEPCPSPPPGDFWIFAYGSLIWDPGFPFAEARPATLKGYHRAFCLFSTRYRGTAEKPGLVLGLDRGGTCRGIVYRVDPAHGAPTMSYLWDREMLSSAYVCKDLRVAIEGGEVTARTFVIRRGAPNYAGKLTVADTATYIRQGHGQRGSNRAYLENTVRHLDQLGIPDRRLHLLLRAVEAAP